MRILRINTADVSKETSDFAMRLVNISMGELTLKAAPGGHEEENAPLNS